MRMRTALLLDFSADTRDGRSGSEVAHLHSTLFADLLAPMDVLLGTLRPVISACEQQSSTTTSSHAPRKRDPIGIASAAPTSRSGRRSPERWRTAKASYVTRASPISGAKWFERQSPALDKG